MNVLGELLDFAVMPIKQLWQLQKQLKQLRKNCNAMCFTNTIRPKSVAGVLEQKSGKYPELMQLNNISFFHNL